MWQLQLVEIDNMLKISQGLEGHLAFFGHSGLSEKNSVSQGIRITALLLYFLLNIKVMLTTLMIIYTYNVNW